MHILKAALPAEYIRRPRARLVWHIRATADKSSFEVVIGTTGDTCTNLRRFMLPHGADKSLAEGEEKG
jgi:hypothetical protein